MTIPVFLPTSCFTCVSSYESAEETGVQLAVKCKKGFASDPPVYNYTLNKSPHDSQSKGNTGIITHMMAKYPST